MTETQKQTKTRIEAQTNALSEQLDAFYKAETKDEQIKELEKYQEMLKKADFSIESQAASKRQELSRADKFFAPKINKITKAVNKLNKKLEDKNKSEKEKSG